MTAPSDQRVLMDAIYRHQRHIYDLSRRNYLLGRDRLLDDLTPPPGAAILELGCGTGRNLISVARRHPDVRLYGVDISHEMLRTAQRAIARHGVYDRIRLAEADAECFDPEGCFGIGRFDRVFFSYTLSMIPRWRSALAKAVSLLPAGGRLHVVDFGNCDGLPDAFRHGLEHWLAMFHVTPRVELREQLAMMGAKKGDHVRFAELYRGYALSAAYTVSG